MDWQPIARGDRFFVGGDPYFQLRTVKGFASVDPAAVRPVIVRLKERGPASLLGQAGVLAVPSFYTTPAAGLQPAEHCTALVEQEFIEKLPADHAISRITVLPPIDRATIAAEPDVQESIPAIEGGLARGLVVIGVIDYGIAFAHERFRLSHDTTRIEYFWVQDARRPADPMLQLEEAPSAYRLDDGTVFPRRPVPVNPVPYGRELSAPAIDGLLTKLAGGALADEDALYREAAGRLGGSWLRSVSRRAAHGTHVMDLACGYAFDEEERERRPIVAVQLPEATTADTSGETLDAYALDGLRYILDRADAIARQRGCGPLPVVVNFSYGNVAGPHDGSSDLEQAIDEVARARRQVAPFQLVIPSGNSHLARLHAEVRCHRLGQKVPLRWRVLPDDKTPSFLEIWLPRPRPADPKPWRPGDASRISLKIVAPGGQTSDPLGEDDGAGIRLTKAGQVLCEARYRHIPGPPGEHGRGMFLVALQPTTWNEAGAPLAPSGIWTIELENRSLTPADRVEAWIQRDDTPYGFRARGRQSYFDHECYQRFDAQGREIVSDTHPEQAASPCAVKRAGSINAIATGRETIVVGGYLRKERRRARYSARGESSPRYMAPSDDSRAHPGVLAAGTRSGSFVTMNGTSVAAPQVARWLADQLANGGAASVGRGGRPGQPGGSGGGRGHPTWPRRRPGERTTEDVVDAETGEPATLVSRSGESGAG